MLSVTSQDGDEKFLYTACGESWKVSAPECVEVPAWNTASTRFPIAGWLGDGAEVVHGRTSVWVTNADSCLRFLSSLVTGKAESAPKKRAHGPSLGNAAGTGKGNGVEGKRRRMEVGCGGENREPDGADGRPGTLGGRPCKKKEPRGVKCNKTKKLIPGQLKLTSFFRV